MKNLLDTWAELEPDEIIKHELGWYIFPAPEHKISFWASKDTFEDENRFNNVYEIAPILMAIQQSIETKGWGYKQVWSGPGSLRIAYVHLSDGTQMNRCEASTHAEALLGAYLKVLKTTKYTAQITSN